MLILKLEDFKFNLMNVAAEIMSKHIFLRQNHTQHPIIFKDRV